MNDFLHSLRTGKDKRYDRSRRGQENMPYRPGDRQQSMDRRRKSSYTRTNSAENAYLTIAKVLPPVRSLLESIVSDRQAFLKIEERKAAAMEAIARCLQHLAGIPDDEAFNMHKMQDDSASAFAAGNDTVDEGHDVEQESTVEIIKNLREEGLSYEKIANQLASKEIPTPSGKGTWRGQTVSNLLKRSPAS